MRDSIRTEEKTIRPLRGNTMAMEVIPEAHEMLAYLLNHEDQLSEWEQNYVSNMTYWLKVRRKEPDQVQLMLLSVIYNKLKKSA